MQTGVLGHIVCLLLLRNQSLKMRLHTKQNTENRQVTQEAASNTHSGIQDNHTEGEKCRNNDYFRDGADLVPKEYHNLLSPVLAYRSVTQLGERRITVML